MGTVGSNRVAAAAAALHHLNSNPQVWPEDAAVGRRQLGGSYT